MSTTSRIAGTTAAALAALVLAAGHVHAAPIFDITTADGVGADSFVHQGSGDENYGGSARLLVKNGSIFNVLRKTYLRFDLSTLTGPGPVVDASLALTRFDDDDGENIEPPRSDWTLDVFGLNDGADGDGLLGDGGWVEGTGTPDDPVTGDGSINWDNAPANAANNALSPDATLLGQLLVTADDAKGDVVTFSAPGLVEFLNNDTNGLVTFIVRRQDEHNNHSNVFSSKENTEGFAPPTLTLTVVPTPTAGLMGLALLGGLGAMRPARRRQKVGCG